MSLNVEYYLEKAKEDLLTAYYVGKPGNCQLQEEWTAEQIENIRLALLGLGYSEGATLGFI